MRSSRNPWIEITAVKSQILIFALMGLCGSLVIAEDSPPSADPGITSAAINPESKSRNITFLVTSDVHYDTFENEDRNDRDRETIRRMNDIASVTWPTELGGDPITKPRGVMVLGDIIDDGDRILKGKLQSRRQYLLFEADFGLDGTDGLLDYPVYESWGNHDGPPEGSEKNGFSFQAQLKRRNVLRKQNGWLSGLSDNRLHYSWDWDGVHFVQLGIYPADRQNSQVKYSADWHNPQDTLAFLKSDLAGQVGSSGRPVVLMSHCGFDTDWWHPDDWRALYEAVKSYNVILYLYGHTGTGLRLWAPEGQTKQLQCVNTGQTENGFFVVQITDTTVRLAYQIKNRIETKGDDGTVKKTWDGNWQWKFPLKFTIPNQPQDVSQESGNSSAAKNEYRDLRGANYVPSYARNDVQLWMDFDPVVIDRELGYAAKLKLNCVRVFLQFATYEADPKKFLGKFEQCLILCDNHRIQMMPVLFDSCFGDFPDLKEYRDKDWMAGPGQNRLGAEQWPCMEQYVRDIVGGHKQDRRIVMWDVMNEPTCTRFYEQPSEKKRIHQFLWHFLDFVKGLQPSQPTTVGLMSSEEIPLVIDKIGVVSFHNYTPGLREDIRQARAMADRVGKPVVINEVVHRPEQPFELAMQILTEERIGWVFWELMLGKTQFSRGDHPIQGLLYPDGTCRDAGEITAVLGIDIDQAVRLFPERPRPVVTEDGIRYEGFWTRWNGNGPRKDRLFYSTSPRDKAILSFSGSRVALVHKIGPDCGIVQIGLDSDPNWKKVIDTYSPDVEWNHVTELVSGLSEGPHIIYLIPTGRNNPQSSNCYVQIVDLEMK